MLDKIGLKSDIKDMLIVLKSMDDQDQSIDTFAEMLANALDAFVKSAKIVATPDAVVTAVMLAGGNPVTATNNLESTIS